jgi:hypothetical protein
MATSESETPHSDDPVIAHLQGAAEAYRDIEAQKVEDEREIETLRHSLNEARGQTHRMQAELDAERWNAERERQRAECLKEAMRQIHGALFSGDVSTLILRACLTISGATRGMYVTSRRPDGALRVRAEIDVDAIVGGPPPPVLAELCREALEKKDTIVCNEAEAEERFAVDNGEGLRFRNCVAAPVVLLANLDGVVLAADKKDGDFDDRDIEALISVGDQAAVAVKNRHLERALQTAYVHTVTILADAVEAKDPYTHGPLRAGVALRPPDRRAAGPLEYERALVCYGALPARRGEDRRERRRAQQAGSPPSGGGAADAGARARGARPAAQRPRPARRGEVVLHHHEHYDGSGYPDGMSGDEIPMPARIVAVADAYCAMITRRSYKEAYSESDARAELRRCSGTQFDPEIVDAFLAVLDTPEAQDQDDDDFAECGLLPGFERLHGDVTAGWGAVAVPAGG